MALDHPGRPGGGNPPKAPLPCSRELPALLPGRLDAIADIGRKVGQMHALRALLTFLDPNHRDRDLTRGNFPNEFVGREMRKVVPRDILDRNDGLPIVLCHEEKDGFHAANLGRAA